MSLLFKDLLSTNDTILKANMAWQNYDLNDTVLPVVDLVKDHALMVLSKSYGLFHVEQDILDPLTVDVFIYFPILLQQLAITRLIDAYGVVKDDVETQETVRTEKNKNTINQDSELKSGTTVSDSATTDMEQKNTGTVRQDNDTTNNQITSTDIQNNSNVSGTGGRNVNLNHSMPDQAIDSTTGKFPVDSQGSPVLTDLFVQNATQSFNTANPLSTTETSTQSTNNNVTGTNDNLTTNDLTSKDTGTTTRNVVNGGSDVSESVTVSDADNTLNEKITSTVTNKQYAYEIKAFLETADSLIAFRKWEDRFSWVVGII